VKFKKISIPTARKINSNSRGEGDFRSTILLRKYDATLE